MLSNLNKDQQSTKFAGFSQNSLFTATKGKSARIDAGEDLETNSQSSKENHHMYAPKRLNQDTMESSLKKRHFHNSTNM